ncbi:MULTISPECIES: hypothetical protein [Clostridium]|uniref:hypothetical protein n=1 Tax=Clostridium TaxID=1485 RepID=UPI000824C85E|nr:MULTISPECIES: hypothetical protein [Clostridium]PJI09511.1 hypothetical protein CUB90_17295 [Clostridium sp. CT7]
MGYYILNWYCMEAKIYNGTCFLRNNVNLVCIYNLDFQFLEAMFGVVAITFIVLAIFFAVEKSLFKSKLAVIICIFIGIAYTVLSEICHVANV